MGLGRDLGSGVCETGIALKAIQRVQNAVRNRDKIFNVVSNYLNFHGFGFILRAFVKIIVVLFGAIWIYLSRTCDFGRKQGGVNT